MQGVLSPSRQYFLAVLYRECCAHGSMVLLVGTPCHDPGSQYEPPGKMWLYHAPIDNITRGHIPEATKPVRESCLLTTGRPGVTGERRDTRRLGASRIVACYYGI